MADQAGKPVAKVRAEYADAKRREMLIGMILENKVLESHRGQGDDRRRLSYIG
ncbi:MAG: hypothetical protein QM784_27570 [Polyangiaceae bacterium]